MKPTSVHRSSTSVSPGLRVAGLFESKGGLHTGQVASLSPRSTEDEQLFALVLRNQLYKCTFNEYICISFTLYISALEKKSQPSGHECIFSLWIFLVLSYLVFFLFVFSLCSRHPSQVILHCPSVIENISDREKKKISFNSGFR